MKRQILGLLICLLIVCTAWRLGSGHRHDLDFQDGSTVRIRRGRIITWEKDGKTLARRKSRKKIYYSKSLDVDRDGEDELILLLGTPRINGKKDLCIIKKDLSFMVKDFNVSILNPKDFMIGEVNGDGVPDLLMLVYKTSRLHPVYAWRPFFYQVSEGTLKPLWRGSRLSSPFTEIVLCDTDGDEKDELIAVEYNRYCRKYLRAYQWNGFGFTGIASGKDYLEIRNLRIQEGVLSAEFMEEKTQTGEAYIQGERILTKEMRP